METYKYACYDDNYLGVRLRYSDLSNYYGNENDLSEEEKKKLFIIPENCTGSNLSGNSRTVSNYQVFIRDFWDKDVEGVCTITGDHNSYGIAVRLDVYENNKEVQEAVDCLECECVLDDEHFYNLEHEWLTEAISSAYTSDIYGEIFMDDDHDNDTDIENQELVELWINEAIEHLNIQVEYKEVDCVIDSRAIVPYIKDMLILSRNDLPCYTNRVWSCDHTRNIFLEKLASGSYIAKE